MCAAGFMQAQLGKSECWRCNPGQSKQEKGNQRCTNCSAGSYSANFASIMCTRCAPGQYASLPGQMSCIACPTGFMQLDVGKLECILNPIAIVLPILAVFLLTSSYFIGSLICKQLKAWKPQSPENAALAKRFVVPKFSKALKPIVEELKLHELTLRNNGYWDEEAVVDLHRQIVDKLISRIEEAKTPEQMKIMSCALNMDQLHDFKTLYESTMNNIKMKEKLYFNRFLRLGSDIRALCPHKCPANANDFLDLYKQGRAIWSRYHDFIERAAAFADAETYSSHGERPSMKGVYRVTEKGLFKYNKLSSADDFRHLRFGKVRDLVRGGIIHESMAGLCKVLEFFRDSQEIGCCRVKNRFETPSDAGWTDMMLNFYFADDPNHHVCEVQLIHYKMFSQRTTQDGHDGYNVFRASYELLAYHHEKGQIDYDELRRMLMALDANGDGQVSQKEIQFFTDGTGFSRKAAARTVSALDIDHDGILTTSEIQRISTRKLNENLGLARVKALATLTGPQSNMSSVGHAKVVPL